MKQAIEIYQGADGQAQVEVRFGQETVWLSQAQMAQVFDTSTDNISLHLKNIFAEQELDEAATTEDFSVVRQEGQRTVKRKVKHYSLDAVLSVGYRVKSRHATQFRIWATGRLKDYLLKGYALNHQRLQQNAAELEQALALIRKTAASPELTVASGRGLVDIVSRYMQTFLWLQQYDEGLLNDPPVEDGGVLPTPDEARAALAGLKAQLMARGEATDLFARERGDGLAALLGNLSQSVFGEAAYPSIESKAAHLLYFVVKNHPFTDGNKRSGAFLFVGPVRTVFERCVVLQKVIRQGASCRQGMDPWPGWQRRRWPFERNPKGSCQTKRHSSLCFLRRRPVCAAAHASIGTLSGSFASLKTVRTGPFLHRNRRLLDANGQPIINDTGLAALTLLVAESDPQQKEVLIRLVMHMLQRSD